MKIAILGSGIIGTSTAWWLSQAGHEVVVIDRQSGPVQEASRVGGGQISVSHAEPWAHPRAPVKFARWMFQEDAPLLFRPRLDPYQWWWALNFLRECLPGRLIRNVRAMVSLSEYSRQTLQLMRAQLNIEHDHREGGILNFYRDEAEFEQAQAMAGLMRDFGVDRRVLSPDEVIALEPALAQMRSRLAGGGLYCRG